MAIPRRKKNKTPLGLPRRNPMMIIREGKKALPRVLDGRENATRQQVIARYQAMATWVPGGRRRQASKSV